MFEDNYPEGLKRVFIIKGTVARLHIFKGVSPLFSSLICSSALVLSFPQLPKCFPWPTT